MRTAGEPPNALALATEAVARVGAATGLHFVFDGTTDTVAQWSCFAGLAAASSGTETEGVPFSEELTYAGDGPVAAPDIVAFNHGLADTVNALFGAGLTLTAFEEHREVPGNPLGDGMVTRPDDPAEFVLADAPARLPLTCTRRRTGPALALTGRGPACGTRGAPSSPRWSRR